MLRIYNFVALTFLLRGVATQDTRALGPESDNEMRTRLSYLEEKTRRLEERLAHIDDDSSPVVVAFSAYASIEYDYNNDDVIIFDRVVTNLGGAYSVDSNRFTCPVLGLYAFSVSIFQSFDYDNAIAASIMVDDVGEIAEVTVKAYPTEDLPDSSSATVFVECHVGQRVWVEVDNTNGGQVYGGVYEPDSMFSGALIRAL